ncbi:hypothetical protein AVT69_gp305 [Pseudomonas phage PhiPA3]|uniref:Uncharacterized protein 307 n=1 Tax=Pseudomonas phage PhiPA3 TaxID=998086 RepID=F8SJE3_BPPA3|nr:hypothetical protein AVT69_gp305 [Pseudomonas phage PhiPA3]AEH03730.1 hypothetical protein [Pseudomonas phage PhiPA3]
MATLKEDVLGQISFELLELRQALLDDVPNMTPSKLIDRAITGATTVLEKNFEFKAKAVQECNGDPHWCVGITEKYWEDLTSG